MPLVLNAMHRQRHRDALELNAIVDAILVDVVVTFVSMCAGRCDVVYRDLITTMLGDCASPPPTLIKSVRPSVTHRGTQTQTPSLSSMSSSLSFTASSLSMSSTISTRSIVSDKDRHAAAIKHLQAKHAYTKSQLDIAKGNIAQLEAHMVRLKRASKGVQVERNKLKRRHGAQRRQVLVSRRHATSLRDDVARGEQALAQQDATHRHAVATHVTEMQDLARANQESVDAVVVNAQATQRVAIRQGRLENARSEQTLRKKVASQKKELTQQDRALKSIGRVHDKKIRELNGAHREAVDDVRVRLEASKLAAIRGDRNHTATRERTLRCQVQQGKQALAAEQASRRVESARHDANVRALDGAHREAVVDVRVRLEASTRKTIRQDREHNACKSRLLRDQIQDGKQALAKEQASHRAESARHVAVLKDARVTLATKRRDEKKRLEKAHESAMAACEEAHEQALTKEQENMKRARGASDAKLQRARDKVTTLTQNNERAMNERNATSVANLNAARQRSKLQQARFRVQLAKAESDFTTVCKLDERARSKMRTNRLKQQTCRAKQKQKLAEQEASTLRTRVQQLQLTAKEKATMESIDLDEYMEHASSNLDSDSDSSTTRTSTEYAPTTRERFETKDDTGAYNEKVRMLYYWFHAKGVSSRHIDTLIAKVVAITGGEIACLPKREKARLMIGEMGTASKIVAGCKLHAAPDKVVATQMDAASEHRVERIAIGATIPAAGPGSATEFVAIDVRTSSSGVAKDEFACYLETMDELGRAVTAYNKAGDAENFVTVTRGDLLAKFGSSQSDSAANQKKVTRLIMGEIGRLTGQTFDQVNSYFVEQFCFYHKGTNLADAVKTGLARQQQCNMVIEEEMRRMEKEADDEKSGRKKEAKDESLVDSSRPTGCCGQMGEWACQKLLSPLCTNEQVCRAEGYETKLATIGVKLAWVKELGNRKLASGMNCVVLRQLWLDPRFGVAFCQTCRAKHEDIASMVPSTNDNVDTHRYCACCYIESKFDSNGNVVPLNRLDTCCVTYLTNPRVIQEWITMEFFQDQGCMPMVRICGTVPCVLDMKASAIALRAGFATCQLDPERYLRGDQRMARDDVQLEFDLDCEDHDLMECFYNLDLRTKLGEFAQCQVEEHKVTDGAHGWATPEFKKALEQDVLTRLLTSLYDEMDRDFAKTVDVHAHCVESIDYSRHWAPDFFEGVFDCTIAVARESSKMHETQTGKFIDWEPTDAERRTCASIPPHNCEIESLHATVKVSTKLGNRKNGKTGNHSAKATFKRNRVLDILETSFNNGGAEWAQIVRASRDYDKTQREALSSWEGNVKRAQEQRDAEKTQRRDTLDARRVKQKEVHLRVTLERDMDEIAKMTGPRLKKQLQGWNARANLGLKFDKVCECHSSSDCVNIPFKPTFTFKPTLKLATAKQPKQGRAARGQARTPAQQEEFNVYTAWHRDVVAVVKALATHAANLDDSEAIHDDENEIEVATPSGLSSATPPTLANTIATPPLEALEVATSQETCNDAIVNDDHEDEVASATPPTLANTIAIAAQVDPQIVTPSTSTSTVVAPRALAQCLVSLRAATPSSPSQPVFMLGEVVLGRYDMDKDMMMGTVTRVSGSMLNKVYSIKFVDGDVRHDVVELSRAPRVRRRKTKVRWNPDDAASMPQWNHKIK